MLNGTLIIALLALFTGFIAGGLFAFTGVPIPAPPNIAGILGIVGIYLGYKAIEYLGVGYDILDVFGL